MKWMLNLLAAAYAAVAALFGVTAGWLLFSAGYEIWDVLTGLDPGSKLSPAVVIFESMGLLAVALVALEIAQTIVEEQVIRRVHVSAPTRARRYLSRFFVVIVVAMAIETLVAAVTLLRTKPSELIYAAWIGGATALLLGSWGLFVWLNRAAEELEPEAMKETKQEDKKLRT